MNFSVLPPEINSALMYAGPGSGSMLAAAMAWDQLAIDLYSAASSYESVITTLTAGPWIGPSSTSMAAAVAPYVSWLGVTAAQAEQASDQARAAVVAYEGAFAETVPPPVVAANRSLLIALVATNLFGQNTPLISLTEAHYADMWAQDTAAMQGYATASAAATALTPFTGPADGTNQGGMSSQAAAVAQAANTVAGDAQSAVSNAAQALSAVPSTLTGLAAPAAPGGMSLLDILDLLGDISGVFFDPEIGTAGLLIDGLLSGTALPYDINGYYIGEHTDDIISGWAGVQTWPGTDAAPPTAFPVIGSPVAAGLGEARAVGALSVPAAWTTNAPATRLSALGLPATAAAPEVSASGAGAVFSQMALAGMAGSAMGGGIGGGAGGPRARERAGVGKPGALSKENSPVEDGTPTPTPAPTLPGGPITSIAAELRELASLRDAGILTEAEFTEQKQRLLPR